MDKEEVYELIRSRGLWHEITEHKAVYNMEDASELVLPYPDREAKNLFIRDDKKRSYYLITVRGTKRVDLKAFRAMHGTRPLTFASEAELKSLLGLSAGSVTPMGLLNDKDCIVKLFLDEEFLEGNGIIGVHPNENTATIWLRTEDLLNILREHGSEAELFTLV